MLGDIPSKRRLRASVWMSDTVDSRGFGPGDEEISPIQAELIVHRVAHVALKLVD
jgi:hypothetical protein